MKTYFSQSVVTNDTTEEDYAPVTLKDSIEKTRQALEIAYAGFDNAVEFDLIDSYIYQINALQKRYKHLANLAAAETVPENNRSCKHSPVRSLVSHVLG